MKIEIPRRESTLLVPSCMAEAGLGTVRKPRVSQRAWLGFDRSLKEGKRDRMKKKEKLHSPEEARKVSGFEARLHACGSRNSCPG